MKIRTDFVTNSSSSSFVISRNAIGGREYTKEDIFDLIKEMYRDYANRVEQIRANYDLKKIIIPVLGYEKYDEITKEIKDKYGVEKWDVDCYMGIEWLKKCKNYAEYLHYMRKKIVEKRPEYAETAWRWYVPFRIIDITQDETDFDDEKIADIIFDWYELHKEFKNSESVGFDIGKAICEKFGRYVIWGESGYMPDFVVKQLSQKSSLYCNHMG